MDNPQIQPDKITKPIQLLAVWFAGLVLLEGILLSAAKVIDKPLWLVPTLVISAILIIPIFLAFIFLLQTKYRPQMQEDTLYAKYLDKTTNTVVNLESMKNFSQLKVLQEEILNRVIVMENNALENTQNSNKDKLELYEKREVRLHKILNVVEVNTMLPNYSGIMRTLEKEGYNASGFTGGGNESLKYYEITIGDGVSIEFIRELLKDISYQSFHLLSLVRVEDQEMMNNKDVVVGSYLHKSKYKATIKLTKKIFELINSDISQEEFHELFPNT